MKNKCREKIKQTMRKRVNNEIVELSPVVAKAIEDNIKMARQELLRLNQGEYLKLSTHMQFVKAAQKSADWVRQDAEHKIRKLKMSAKAYKMKERYFGDQHLKYRHTDDALALTSLSREIVHSNDFKDNNLSQESLSHAIRVKYTAPLTEYILSFGPKWLGIVDNNKAMYDVIRELRGTKTDNPAAKEFAGKLSDTFHGLLNEFNHHGGAIRTLDDYGSPQSHSRTKVFDSGINKWINDIMPKLDRQRYFNDDGILMNDVEMDNMLRHIWHSIVYAGEYSHGGMKPPPRRYSGAIADRHKHSRVIFFKDADSFLDYHESYSAEPIIATIDSHILHMSNEIAAMIKHGPHPEQMIDKWIEIGKQQAMSLGKDPDWINKQENNIRDLYKEVMHMRPEPNSKRWAKFMSSARGYMKIKLGSSLFSSMSDPGYAAVTNNLRQMSNIEMFSQTFKSMSSTERRKTARALGMGIDTMLHGINRWSYDNLVYGLPHKIAGVTMRMSFMPFMSDLAKESFGISMMKQLKDWTSEYEFMGQLPPKQLQLLKDHGITDKDWKKLRESKPELIGDDEILSWRNQTDNNVSHKLLSMILSETDVAIPTPGARERVALGSQRNIPGTFSGELMPTILQFKWFTAGIVYKHYSRAKALGAKDGTAYVAAMIAATTILGGIGVQLNELASGRDALHMDNFEFLLKAMLKGGGPGLYSEFIQMSESDSPDKALGVLAGPLPNVAANILLTTLGTGVKTLKGREVDYAPALVKLVKDLFPLSSNFYLKTALDRLIFMQLQEELSPGYTRRIEKRGKKMYGHEYWWRPGELSPERGPDLTRAFEPSN